MGANHKDLVRRLWEAMNARDGAAFDELVDPGFQNHNTFSPPIRGPENFRIALRGLTRGFPDVHYEIERMVEEGDQVWVRLWMSATHHGEFLGLAPPGRSFRSAHVWSYRIENDRIAEAWAVMDDLGSMVQLGIVPPLPAPSVAPVVATTVG